MRPLRLVPDDTRFRFMRWRKAAFAFTLLLTLVSLAALWGLGLNLGVDYAGGLLIEARATTPVDLGTLRGQLDALKLGDVTLQALGGDRDLLIRLQEQPGGPSGQEHAIAAVKSLLTPGFEIRRTEAIGPQVSHELLRDGLLAALLAVVLIGVYVWFRFEWQFGLAAVLTTFHDIIATFGLFAVFHLEFNLTILAALLTIAGYSINDTVVVFDRVRENLRHYKSMPMNELIDRSVNQTLRRTLLTSGTTLLAVAALLIFGGPVLRNFSLALVWGIAVGTYSSIFVASSLLLHLPPLRREGSLPADAQTNAVQAAAGQAPEAAASDQPVRVP
ncbi:MAG: protein translocase subunit SecF [Kiloniellaceae bacterium]